MRSITRQRSLEGISRLFILGFLALIMTTLGTSQALAQGKSCNPDLDFRIADPGPYFLGDALRVSANLGARDIDLGNYMDIESFGFALNCHTGEDFHTCNSAGHTVLFLNQPTTDCMNAETPPQPAKLLVPQGNRVPIRTVGSPIRTSANSQCNVQFDVSVTGLAKDNDGNIINNRVVQAMGWPIEGGDPASCDNGLTSAASSTISYDVETCEIAVRKQVSLDQINWSDADTAESAIDVGTTDRAYYRLVVENTGTADYIGQMHITDDDFDFEGWVDGLAAGEVVELGGQGSEFDVNAICADLGVGEFVFTNTATVEGVCRSDTHALGEVLASGSNVAKINCKPYDINSRPKVRIEKTTNGQDADEVPGPYVAPGSQVTWDYTVYNDGTQAVWLDKIEDNEEGAVSCEKNYLLPAEFTDCTAIPGTAVTGQYANVAKVWATGAGNGLKTEATDPSHYFGITASIDLVKTANPQTFSALDELITYTFAVSNTSNVPLENVFVEDFLTGLSAISCPEDMLAPLGETGSSMYCVATYRITQADLNAGKVDNTATAYGTAPNGNEVSDTDKEEITATLESGLTLVKTAFPATYSKVGDPITYSYQLTNSGEVTLYPKYSVADNKTGVTCPSEPSELDPGGSVTCSATYYITQDDITNKLVTNTAKGTAKDAPSGGNDVHSNEDSETVYYTGIAVLKEVWDDKGKAWRDANDADSAPVANWPAGAQYRITVTNTGLVDLENVVINDTEVGLTNFIVNSGSLAVGQSVELTGGALDVYPVCDKSGSYENTVIASGKAVSGSTEVQASDNAFVVCVGKPDILVKKYISIDDGASWHDAGIPELQEPPLPYIDPADPVPVESGALYKITVKNTGQVDLVDVIIDDPLISDQPYALGNGNDPDDVDLTVNQELVITKAEWPALERAQVCGTSGIFQNVATADGTSAEWDIDSDTDTDDAFLECIGDPRIKVTKEVSVDDGASWHDANTAPYPTALVEDSPEALYRITVKNLDDEVTLYDVVLNDAELGLVDYEIGTLAPLAEVEITPAGHGGDVLDDDFKDLDICPNTGEKTNTVSVTGTSEAGESDTASDLATVECIGSPEIRVVKKVSKDGINFYDANSPAAAVVALAPAAAWYRIEVTNIGNEALENVSITDEDLGIFDFIPEGEAGLGMLGKGETVIIKHANADSNTVPELYDEFACETGGDPFENIVVVVSDSSESGAQPTDDDNAWFDCNEPQNICVDDQGNVLGTPTTLKMEYNSTPTGTNAQGAVGEFLNAYTADDWHLVTTVNISEFIGNKITEGKDIPYVSGSVVVIDGSFREGGASKIPPTIRLEFRTENGEAVQWISFHGSCSAALYVGDEYSGMTIIGHTR